MAVSFSVALGPVVSGASDETREESDGNEDEDSAGTVSFKVCGLVELS